MSQTIVDVIRFETTTCCECGIAFALPERLMRELRSNSKKSFYCPNGHEMVFSKSVLEQENARLKQEKDEAERARMSLHNQLTEKQKEVTKLQAGIKRRNKRIAAGVCPCCNRTFKQLAEHMKLKHPEIAASVKPNELQVKINNK